MKLVKRLKDAIFGKRIDIHKSSTVKNLDVDKDTSVKIGKNCQIGNIKIGK